MQRVVLLVLLSQLIFACMKDAIIGKVYVLDDSIPMYEKPRNDDSAVATIGGPSQVELLAHVADERSHDQSRREWYKVRFAGKTGFVHQGVAMLAKKPPYEKRLLLSDFNAYSVPSEKSRVVQTVKRGSVVEILAESANDLWILVKLPDQKQLFIPPDGYSIASVKSSDAKEEDIQKSLEEHLERRDAEIKELQAAAIITARRPKLLHDAPSVEANPELHTSVNNPSVAEEEDVQARKFEPKYGDVVWVSASTKRRGVTYYNIFGDGPSDGEIPYGGYNYREKPTRWIAATEAKFCESLFACTKDMNRAVAPEILEALEGSGAVDVRGLSVKPLKLGTHEGPGIEYLALVRGKNSQVALLKKEKGRYSVLVWHPTIVDIDSDGVSEIIYENAGFRASRSVTVQSWVNGTYQVILNIPEDISVSYHVESPYLVIECREIHQSPHATGLCTSEYDNAHPAFADQLVRVFTLAKGKLTEVPLPEKYKKRDAELRAR